MFGGNRYGGFRIGALAKPLAFEVGSGLICCACSTACVGHPGALLDGIGSIRVPFCVLCLNGLFLKRQRLQRPVLRPVDGQPQNRFFQP